MNLLSRIIMGLFASAGDGSVSLSKTMKLVGFVTVTYIVLLQAHRGTLAGETFLMYFGLVIGNDQIGKWQSIQREKAQLDSPSGNTDDGNKSQ